MAKRRKGFSEARERGIVDAETIGSLVAEMERNGMEILVANWLAETER